MKVRMITAVLGILMPLVAFAHGTKVELTSLALSTALEQFENAATGAQIKSFLGAKGWVSAGDYRIKIYLEDKEVRIICEEGHEGGQVVMNCKTDTDGDTDTDTGPDMAMGMIMTMAIPSSERNGLRR